MIDENVKCDASLDSLSFIANLHVSADICMFGYTWTPPGGWTAGALFDGTLILGFAAVVIVGLGGYLDGGTSMLAFLNGARDD